MTIAHTYPGESRWLRLALLLATLFLVVGMVAPIVTLKKLVLIKSTFSVLAGVMALLHEGQFFLFVLIGVFSVLLPVLKLAILYKLLSIKEAHSARMAKYLHWMHLYGKWSMLDVFVVAVLVVTVKLGALASVEMRYGLYAFAAAVLLTMYVTARVVKLSDALDRQHGGVV